MTQRVPNNRNRSACARRRRQQVMRQRIFLGVLAAIAVLLIVSLLFIYGKVTYSSKFLPKTTINGVDVSGMTAEEAEDSLTYTLPTITITFDGGEKDTFSLADVGGSYTYLDELNDLIDAQNPYTYLHPKAQDLTLEPVLSYDADLIEGVIDKLPAVTNENATDPTDAYIEKTDSGFEIVPETAGTKIDEQALLTLVSDSLAKWQYEIDGTSCYVQPSVKAEDLSLSDQMQTINNMNYIDVNMSGGKTERIDKATVMSFIIYDADSGDISVDSAAVTAYTQQLAQEYNTLGTVRTFTTTGGSMIQVGGSDKDTFGYQMDVETTAQRIASCCLTGQDTAAKWPVAGSTRGDDNDFGTTYVEVSIPDQHLWYYVNGALAMETDVVTGTGTNSTTPGVFMILDKQHPATLRGDGYSTDVEYWMPVTYSGTGLHDAQWRTEFGKEIYISGGSHGCVNMPLAAVEQLYNSIEMGTPVIIYD